MIVPRLLPCALLALPSTCLAESDPLESAQRTASELVKVRIETARLESDWIAEKELLLSTTTAFEQRAKELELSRTLQVERGRKNAEELAQLRDRNRAAEAAFETAGVDMKAVGEKLLSLRPSLPPRLAKALELNFRSLADAALPAPERTRLTMSALTRCLQFDAAITRSEEVVEIGGRQRALDVVYWGLSHAYAVDRSERKAWRGGPSGGSWQWLAADGSFDAIVRLMNIQSGREDPAFVEVPAKLETVSKK